MSTDTDVVSRSLHIYSENHLGDSIWSIIYFNTIKTHLESFQCHIHYYVNKIYIRQLAEFISSPNITLHPLNERPPTAFNIWIAHSWNDVGKHIFTTHFHIFLAKHFDRVGRILTLPNPFKTEFLYDGTELNSIYETVAPEFKDLDFLIINARPQSYQYVYIPEYWIHYINILKSTSKCAITYPEQNLECPCTITQKYTVKTIAAISTRARYIIAVNSGPVVPLFNTLTMNNIKHMYVFDTVVAYTDHPKITNVKSWDDIIKHIVI